MWNLIRAQFEYHWITISLTVLTSLVVASTMMLLTGDSGDVLKTWRFLVVGVALAINVRIQSIDQCERRQLLSTILPFARSRISLTRILLPIVVQLGVGLLAALSLAASSLFLGEIAPRVLPALLASQGFSLVLAMMILLNEELSLLLSRWRSAIMAFNVGIMAVILAFTFSVEAWLPPFLSWAGIGLSHSLAGVMAVATYILYQRRGSLLIGMSPKSIFPEDWSEAPVR